MQTFTRNSKLTLVREFNYDHRLGKELSRTAGGSCPVFCRKIRKSNRAGITCWGWRLTMTNLETMVGEGVKKTGGQTILGVENFFLQKVSSWKSILSYDALTRHSGWQYFQQNYLEHTTSRNQWPNSATCTYVLRSPIWTSLLSKHALNPQPLIHRIRIPGKRIKIKIYHHR